MIKLILAIIVSVSSLTFAADNETYQGGTVRCYGILKSNPAIHEMYAEAYVSCMNGQKCCNLKRFISENSRFCNEVGGNTYSEVRAAPTSKTYCDGSVVPVGELD